MKKRRGFVTVATGSMLSAETSMHRKNYWHLRIKNGLLFTCYGFFVCMTPGEMLAQTRHKGIAAFCMVPGYALYRYWKKKHM